MSVLDRPLPMRRIGHDIVPIYVWDLVVRWTHWLIVLSILVLAVVGSRVFGSRRQAMPIAA